MTIDHPHSGSNLIAQLVAQLSIIDIYNFTCAYGRKARLIITSSAFHQIIIVKYLDFFPF